MKRALLLSGCVCVLVCCKKENDMPKEPEIELVSIGPTDVEEFTDVVTLHFKYTDGDGDIGQVDPDVPSLRVKDSRLPEADWYHLPPLTPELQELAIQGELELPLNTLFLLGNSGTEVLTYSIVLVDRAGNYSNELVSPSITVHDSL